MWRRTPRSPLSPWQLLSLVSLVCVSLVFLVDRATQFLTEPPIERINYDVVGDFVFVKAAWAGLDPYQPLETLESEFGGGAVEGWPSKLPAVALLMAPLLLTDADGSVKAMTWVNIAMLVLLVFLTTRVLRSSFWPWLVITPLLAVTRPVVQGFAYATPVFSVSVLVVLTWLLAQKGDRSLYGLPLGLAISLRLWPFLLLGALLVHGRRRAATGAILTALIATVGGLAIVGFRINDSVTGLITANSFWRSNSSNGSLAGVLDRAGAGDGIVWALTVVGALLLGLLPLRAGLDRSLACAVSAGIVLSPLSWPHYSMVALPVCGLVWASRRARPLLAVSVCFLVSQIRGDFLFVGRVLLLVAALQWSLDPTSGSARDRLSGELRGAGAGKRFPCARGGAQKDP